MPCKGSPNITIATKAIRLKCANGGAWTYTMARHIAVHIQQVIDFAKARGKQANELSDEDLVELQEVMEAEEGDE